MLVFSQVLKFALADLSAESAKIKVSQIFPCLQYSVFYHVYWALFPILFWIIEGFKEAAERFQCESSTKPMTDLDTLNERILIREAIQDGHIEDAISKVNDLHPELLDNDRYLYFHLQVRSHDYCIHSGSCVMKS